MEGAEATSIHILEHFLYFTEHGRTARSRRYGRGGRSGEAKRHALQLHQLAQPHWTPAAQLSQAHWSVSTRIDIFEPSGQSIHALQMRRAPPFGSWRVD